MKDRACQTPDQMLLESFECMFIEFMNKFKKQFRGQKRNVLFGMKQNHLSETSTAEATTQRVMKEEPGLFGKQSVELD